MRDSVLTTVQALIAAAALAFASFALASQPADAASQIVEGERYCYAGCCLSCDFLCCSGGPAPTLQ